MNNQTPISKPDDSEQRSDKGLSVQRLVRYLRAIWNAPYIDAKRDALIIDMMRDCLKAEDTVWMPRGNETYFERLYYILSETGWPEEKIEAEFPEYFHLPNAEL